MTRKWPSDAGLADRGVLIGLRYAQNDAASARCLARAGAALSKSESDSWA